MSRLRTATSRTRVVLTQLFVLLLAATGVIALPATPVAAATLITENFAYTGTTQTFTVPPGVTSIEVTLQGGQGGRGGHDSQGTPTPGGYQGVVTGTISVTPGQEITVAVGGGGGTGRSSANNTGGGTAGLNPLTGYDGAVGGNAGNAGSSGAGGGSGAATVLIVDGAHIVAGGAGGNGGSGQYEPIVGRRAESTHTARPDAVSTTGRPGWNTADACTVSSCDGGGSGAGGGGAVGGERGTIQYGGASATEYFGFGGFPGESATAGIPTLSATYDYYAGNSAHGSLAITYSDGAPGAPLNLAGTSATAAVGLGWDEPSSPGSSPISDYVIEYATSSGGPFTTFADGVSLATSVEVTGLTNGVAYYFRVTAVNDVGAGAPAVTSVGIVPSDVPDRPVVDAVTASGGGAHVDFTPGHSDIEITSYEYRLDGGAWQAGSVSAGRMTITGLTNGATYSVEIRAINAIGPSLESTPAVSVTPIDVPQAPSGTLLSAGDATIDVEWTAPAATNGSPVSDYLIQWATAIGGPYTTVDDGISTATTHPLAGLTNGTTYFVRIAAVNAAGASSWSTPVSATPYTSPSAPLIGITPGDGSLTVDITPGFDGGSAVTQWEYQLDGGSWTATGSLTNEFTVFGLANATSYDVSVRATNAAGIGAASSAVSATPRTVPVAPAISAVALDTGAVSVTFTVGATGGSPISNVEYSIDEGATWVTRSPASSSSPLTVAGLTGGVTYPIQLRVLNDAGASAPSNTSSVTAKGAPAAPTIAVAPADSALVVTFTAPANGGSPITNYEYSIDDGATWVVPSPAAKSPLAITGLTNGTSYPVRLRAVNEAGYSPASAAVTGTPRTVPGAPTINGDTVADAGSGMLSAAFTAPASNGGSAITTYQYSTDAGATWRTRADGFTVESPLIIETESSDGTTPLTGGVTYPVELRAVNAAGPGTASAVATGITTTVPDAPVIDTVDSGDQQAIIRFTPPANGGAAIIRYEYSLDAGATWIDTGSLDDDFTVTGLTNSSSVSLEMRAVNSVGDGAASAPVTVTAFTAPAAPTLGTVSAGDRTLDIAFVAGADGGSSITDYEYSTDGGVTWRGRATGTTGSPITIESESDDAAVLVNGTVYDVQIRAINASGPSAASESRLAAPRGVPAMPSGLTVNGADSALVIAFIAGSDGGSPITAVEYQLDGGPWLDAGSLNSPFNIPGLVNGTSYDVTLRTRNAVGTSPVPPVESGTARTVPGVPTAVSSTGASGQVSVTWAAPAADGGVAITGYTVRVFAAATGGTPIANCTTTGATTCVVDGLVNGVTVYADVAAGNAAGEGAASTPRVAAVPLGAPVVQIDSVTSSATSLSVDVLLDDGGRPVSDYEYQLDDGAWQSASSASNPFTIPGLTTGVEYSVRIRAIGPGGTSEPSDPVLATPYTLPGAPTGLAAAGGAASASLTWSGPSSDGGTTLTDYVVQYATSSGGPFTTFADGTSAATTVTVTGLTNATTYYFRVAAQNAAGAGSFSSLASATPLAAPGAPTITGITPGSTFLQVAFTAPSDNGGSTVTGYQYRLDAGTWRTASSSSSPMTITGLTNGTAYDVELRAVNSVGGGSPSAVVAATPFGLPGAIVGLRATPGANNVLLEWDTGNDNGSPITSYNVIRWSAANEGSISASFTTTSTSRNVTGLANGTYYFTVEATNAAGTGPRSTPRTTAIIGSTLPSAPTALALVVDDRDAVMSWTPGASGSSTISSYLVQYSTDGSSWTTMSSGSSAASASFDLPSSSTPYELRVAAISAAGAGAFAEIGPPLASTGVVNGVTAFGADLSGVVDANGGSASPSFQYATDPADLGTVSALSVDASPSPVSGSGGQAISASLGDLDAGTEYSVQAVATMAGATVRGAVITFTTAGSIVTDDVTPVYTGAPVLVAATTMPADLAVTRTFVGIDGTDYPSSSTPPTDVGTYEMTTVSADADVDASETVTLTIVPKPATVTVAAVDRPYDGTTLVGLSLGLDGIVSGDDVMVNAANISAAMADADAGADKAADVVVDGALATGADAASYDLSIADTVVVTITRSSQTVTFTTSAPEPAFVGSTYATVAESSAGLPVTVTIDESSDGVCSVVDGVITFESAGSCMVGASQAGNSNVEAAAPTSQIFDVTRSPQTVELGLDDVVLGDDPISLPATIDGRPLTYVAGPSAVCSVSGTSLRLNGAGTCEVTATQAGTVQFLPAEATDTFVVGLASEPRLGIDLGADQGGVSADDTLTIDGAGLRAGSTVHITIDATSIGTAVQVGADGTYRTVVRLPDDVTPGVRSLVVTGISVDGSTVRSVREVFVDWSGSMIDLDDDGYEPVVATRILDTRSVPGRLIAGTEYRVEVPAGLVDDDATALTVNLTVARASAPGYLQMYPCGTQRPDASVTNFTAGEPRANLVDVPFERGAALCLWSLVDTDAVVDVQGFHSSSGDRLVPRTATRLVDTRIRTALEADETRVVRVVGSGMASDSTTVVALNVAAVRTESRGFVTVFPCGADRPATSNLNFVAGQTVSNEVLVQPGENGTVCVYSSTRTDLVVDLDATFEPAGPLAFSSVVASRVGDTRTVARLAAGETATWTVAEGVAAVSLNVIATATGGRGFLTVFPCDVARPWASNVNFDRARQTASNHVTVPVDDDGKVCVYTSAAAHIVLDVQGVYRNPVD